MGEGNYSKALSVLLKMTVQTEFFYKMHGAGYG